MGKVWGFFIFTVLLFLKTENIEAQATLTDSLSFSSEVTFQKVAEKLKATPSKTKQKQAEELLNHWKEQWSGGTFNSKQKTEVQRLTDTLMKHRIAAYPYLYRYISTIILLGEQDLDFKSFKNWHKHAVELLLTQKPKYFLQFLDKTRDFFLNRRLHLINGSYSWYYRNATFQFSYNNGFKIQFQKTDLICASKRDSSVIKNTSGFYDLQTHLWHGNKGTLDWGRFGEKVGRNIYAEFDRYQLNLEKNHFTIDSARLHYNQFFKHPQLGTLKDRVMASPPLTTTRYPMFSLYQEGFELNKIFPYFNLKCNLSIEGQKLLAKGFRHEKANAVIKTNDTVFAKFSSEQFYIDSNKIESPHTAFVFYINNDSIVHPDLKFRYLGHQNVVFLYSTMKHSKEIIPFTDTYHKMDLYIPVFYWDVAHDTVYLQNFKQLRKDYTAIFESVDYYAPKDFASLQVMDQKNPLYLIYHFIKKYEIEDNEIEVPLLAEFLRKPEEQVVALLLELASKGFVIYYPKERKAIVKDKLYHYIKAKKGLADYDAIHLVSHVSGGANAILDLKTQSLNIFGIPEVTLSDSQAVYLKPYNQSISVKKNRDFSFEGSIQVGLLDFYVKNSMFVYDSFLLNLNYIDSMAFYTVEKDTTKAEQYQFKRVNNVITNMIGALYIDEPGNKSGTFKFPQYPIFANKENGFVYFNRKEIQDSTLTPDKVYYKVDPFIFDSVSQFLTNGLAFKGSLITSSIFPEIKEYLTIMPDNSLGFIHQTPDSGYSIYGGKGKFFNEITLDNNGLKGKGSVTFLNANFVSDNITFFPDSLKATARRFVINGTDKGYEFPMVTGDSLSITWQTTDTNVMNIAVIDSAQPLKMFDNAQFNGSLTLTPDSLKGSGIFQFDKADIASQAMSFTPVTVAADSATFMLFDDERKNKIFLSKGYFVNIDFDRSVGTFQNLNSSGDSTFVEFPYSHYASTLNELQWLMDQQKLILSSKTGNSDLDSLPAKEVIKKTFDQGEFISLNPQQDSLRFYAKRGEYDYNLNTLTAEGVRFIKTGDAAVFPRQGMIKILADGLIDTLYQAEIITDTADLFHKIYDAEVHILSKDQFTANGFINYYDRNKLPQQIYLNDIHTNEWGKTIGHGRIEAGDYFFLSPEYFFKGDVELISTERFLKFNGGFRINEECLGQEDNWVAFNRFVNPEKILFTIDANTLTLDSAQAQFGLAFSYRLHKFYPLVLQPKESVADQICIESTGILDYDTTKNTFRVGTAERLNGNFDAKGNYVELDNKHCALQGDGTLHLKTKFYRIGFRAAGLFKHLIIPDSTYFRTALILKFHFDQEVLSMMTDSLRMAQGKVVNMDKSPFRVALRELTDKETANRLKVEMSLYGQFNDVPPSLEGTIIFTDVKLRWDPYSRSYLSEGPLGIGFINGKAVNKYMEGKMQIQLGRSGSHLHFYLHPGGKSWYFFTYSNGIMQSISSDMNYNITLSEIKEDKRVLHPKDEDNYYEYVISTKRKMVDFLRRMDKINRLK